MTRLPTPLAEIDQRVPEAGRIRLGVKTAKGMTSIDTFRFTSPDASVIKRLAELYGGEARQWRDVKASPPDQWEVITKVSEIDVYLPANALSVWYELWSGGGVQRRCDGQTCQVPQTVPGGWEMVDAPCICVARNAMECRPYTRMNVILPTIAFRGVWRLETKGWNAAKELPGMVQIIEAMTQQGRLVQARLHVQRRVQQTPAGRRNFVVPGITLTHTAEDMLLGAADVRSISAAGQAVPALPSADPVVEDDIVDAELVDPVVDELRDRIADIAAQQRIDPDRLWSGIVQVVATGSSLDDDALGRIRNAISKLEAGSLTVVGFNPDGSIIWKR